MNIVLVTPYFTPDEGPSAPPLTMLCEDLAALGHQVTVLAAVPHFPSGRVVNEYRHGLLQWSTQNGVRICRVRVPSGNRADLRHRLLTFFVFQLLTAWVSIRLACDVTLITNPALETWLPFFTLATLRRKPVVWAVWDVYPEVGVRLGIFRHRFVIGVVKALEDYCLRRAQVVQILSAGFRQALEARGVPSDRIVLIPLWLDTEFIQPLSRDTDFAREYGLLDRQVVMYAGNIGYSQGLEHVLTAAQAFSTESHLKFVFVGEGASRMTLQQEANDLALTNVLFIPYQPRERLPQVLASCDLALISLKRGIGEDSIPSKVYPALAAGRPIVAAVDRECGLWNLVEAAGAGLCVEPEDPAQLATAVQTLLSSVHIRQEMSRLGRSYVVEHHSRQAAAREFEQAMRRATTLVDDS